MRNRCLIVVVSILVGGGASEGFLVPVPLIVCVERFPWRADPVVLGELPVGVAAEVQAGVESVVMGSQVG